MNYLYILLLATLFAARFSSVANAASPPEIETPSPPSGPLIGKMPNPSAWRISIIYDSEKPDPVTGKAGTPPSIRCVSGLQEAVRSITVSRSGEVWVAISEDVKGNRLEECGTGSQMFSSDPRHPGVTDVVYPDGGTTGNLASFSNGRFPDLEWVSALTFLGVQKSAGGEYLVFVKEDGTKAFVNAETRFPFQVKTPDRILTYERLPNPPFKLALPDDAAKLKAAIDRDAAIAQKSVSRDR